MRTESRAWSDESVEPACAELLCTELVASATWVVLAAAGALTTLDVG